MKLALSPGVKWSGCEADHSSPSAEVKDKWNYTCTPLVSIHGVYRENLYLYQNHVIASSPHNQANQFVMQIIFNLLVLFPNENWTLLGY